MQSTAPVLRKHKTIIERDLVDQSSKKLVVTARLINESSRKQKLELSPSPLNRTKMLVNTSENPLTQKSRISCAYTLGN